MTKFLLIAFSFLFTFNAFAGNSTKNKKRSTDTRLITGQVIDKNTGEFIAGAEIVIDNKVFYTDLNGMFALTISSSDKDLEINFVSYNKTIVSLTSFCYKPITIELSNR